MGLPRYCRANSNCAWNGLAFSEVQVAAGGTITRNLTISPGAPNEMLVVETSTAQVESDTHAVGGVIQRQTIEDLPPNGRSSLQLATARTRSKRVSRLHVAVQWDV